MYVWKWMDRLKVSCFVSAIDSAAKGSQVSGLDFERSPHSRMGATSDTATPSPRAVSALGLVPFEVPCVLLHLGALICPLTLCIIVHLDVLRCPSSGSD